MRKVITLFVILFIISGCSFKYTQPKSGYVDGVVGDEKQHAVAGAIVKLQGLEVKTNEHGHFVFKQVDDIDNRKLTIEAEGYKPVSVVIPAGQYYRVASLLMFNESELDSRIYAEKTTLELINMEPIW